MALKLGLKALTFLDPEKQMLTLKNPILFEKGSSNFIYKLGADRFEYLIEIEWIDWRFDGNLPACGGQDCCVSIYDQRNMKRVEQFTKLHSRNNSYF